MFLELLIKTMNERMKIKEALDHPWFADTDQDITNMRKAANEVGDEVMKFISYSNAHAGHAKLA